MVEGRVIAAPQVLDGAAADQSAHGVADDANAAQARTEGVVELHNAVGEQRAILPDVLSRVVAHHDGGPAQILADLVGERTAAEGPVLLVDKQPVYEERDIDRSGFAEDGCERSEHLIGVKVLKFGPKRHLGDMGRPWPVTVSKETADGGLSERPGAGANLAVKGEVTSGLNQQRPNEGVAVMGSGLDKESVV